MGRDEWLYDHDQSVSASALTAAFFEAYPDLNALQGTTRIAVDQAFCDRDRMLDGSEEIALIPPVSGG